MNVNDLIAETEANHILHLTTLFFIFSLDYVEVDWIYYIPRCHGQRITRHSP